MWSSGSVRKYEPLGCTGYSTTGYSIPQHAHTTQRRLSLPAHVQVRTGLSILQGLNSYRRLL